jgi:hypothetical protein
MNETKRDDDAKVLVNDDGGVVELQTFNPTRPTQPRRVASRRVAT